MKDNGYTEAELAAAAWRKQQMLAKSVVTNKEDVSRKREKEFSHRRRSISRSRSRSFDQYHRRGWRDRSRSRSAIRNTKVHRDTKHHRREHSKERSRKHREEETADPRSRKDYRIRDDFDDEPELDEFGRVQPKGAARRAPVVRSPSRSRSRSRSREIHRHREDKWTHDKFSSVVYEDDSSAPRPLPSDYRPPSPEWISKAGGVAIMRKKASK